MPLTHILEILSLTKTHKPYPSRPRSIVSFATMSSKKPQNERWAEMERLIQEEKIILELETGKSLAAVTTKFNTKFMTTTTPMSIQQRYHRLLAIKKEVDKVRLSSLLFQYIVPSECDTG